MRRVFLVHGWGGNPKTDWFLWLKKELVKRDFKVLSPEMPDAFKPKISEWVSCLKNIVGEVDKNSYFIGHSMGCQTILRYLETLLKSRKIGGAIFVAGWFNLKDKTWDEVYTKEVAEPWLKTRINFDKIKIHTSKFVAILSDNDIYVPLSDAKIFEEKLGAKIIIEHNKGHISGEDGVKEVPIVLNELLKMVR